jgi:hypothetical protein
MFPKHQMLASVNHRITELYITRKGEDIVSYCILITFARINLSMYKQ